MRIELVLLDGTRCWTIRAGLAADEPGSSRLGTAFCNCNLQLKNGVPDVLIHVRVMLRRSWLSSFEWSNINFHLIEQCKS